MSEETELISYKLQSGRTLRYNISTFDNGKHLYQTIMKEAMRLNISSITELDETLLVKVGMLAMSSTEIENAIWACFDSAVVDGEKLTKEYFKKVAHREDYFEIQVEIAKANLMPFMKSLYAQFQTVFQGLKKSFQA